MIYSDIKPTLSFYTPRQKKYAPQNIETHELETNVRFIYNCRLFTIKLN